MVKEVVINKKKVYQCESCGFHYSDESWAKECEKFCSTRNSCSPEITKHSIERTGSWYYDQ